MNIRSFPFMLVLVTAVLGTLLIAPGEADAQQYKLSKYYPVKEGITWIYLEIEFGTSRGYGTYNFGGTEVWNGETTKKFWKFTSGEIEDYDYSYDNRLWKKEGLLIYREYEPPGRTYVYDPHDKVAC